MSPATVDAAPATGKSQGAFGAEDPIALWRTPRDAEASALARCNEADEGDERQCLEMKKLPDFAHDQPASAVIQLAC